MTPRLPLQSVPYTVNDWSTGGNAGTNPATAFLGTTDARPFILKVNGRRGLHVEDRQNAGDARSVNILGGSEVNVMGRTQSAASSAEAVA